MVTGRRDAAGFYFALKTKYMDYTKGPLTSAGSGVYDKHGVIGVGFMYSKARNIPIKEAEANAKLWAAAPELLDALKRLLPHATTIINEQHPDYKFVMDAIKKATE